MLTLGLAGCGEDEKEFATPTYPFSFEYPEGAKTSRDVEFQSGETNAERQLAVQFVAPYDQMVINQYKLPRPAPEGEPASQREIDALVEDLEKASNGVASDGKVVEVGGLPGYEYVIDFSRDGVELRNTLTFLFRGEDEFQLICQSTEKNREKTEQGCKQITDTISFK